jgi:hypothetical protein
MDTSDDSDDDEIHLSTCSTLLTETSLLETYILETPILETPILETPILETPILETPILETPILETHILETPILETPIFETDSDELTDPDGDPVDMHLLTEMMHKLPSVIVEANRVADILCADIKDVKQRCLLRQTISKKVNHARDIFHRETTDAIHVLQHVVHRVDDIELIPYTCRKQFMTERHSIYTIHIYSFIMGIMVCAVGRYVELHMV